MTTSQNDSKRYFRAVYVFSHPGWSKVFEAADEKAALERMRPSPEDPLKLFATDEGFDEAEAAFQSVRADEYKIRDWEVTVEIEEVDEDEYLYDNDLNEEQEDAD